jgi:hypothetical protein
VHTVMRCGGGGGGGGGGPKEYVHLFLTSVLDDESSVSRSDRYVPSTKFVGKCYTLVSRLYSMSSAQWTATAIVPAQRTSTRHSYVHRLTDC